MDETLLKRLHKDIEMAINYEEKIDFEVFKTIINNYI